MARSEKSEMAFQQVVDAESEARTYKLMLDFERRLDDKFKEARLQSRDDTKGAVEVAVSPVFVRLGVIDQRLVEQQQHFDAQNTRLSAHSDQIDDARAVIKAVQDKQAHASTDALTKKIEGQKSALPWWLPLLIGGALAFVGEKAAKFVINGLADPPAVVAKP